LHAGLASPELIESALPAQNQEYTTETREELLYNKEKLLGEFTLYIPALSIKELSL